MCTQESDSDPVKLTLGEYRKRLRDARNEGAQEARRSLMIDGLPEERLAALLTEHLRTTPVSAIRLRKLLRDQWSEVRKLAHQIHGSVE